MTRNKRAGVPSTLARVSHPFLLRKVALGEDFFPNQIQQVVEEFFDVFFSPSYSPQLKELYQSQSKFPKMEITYDDDNMYIKFHVSGYDGEHLEVNYDEKEQLLIVSGTKEELEGAQNDERVYYSEVRKSNFIRKVPVAMTMITDLDQINSQLSDGILTVTIPMKLKEDKSPKEANVRKIGIKLVE